MLLRHFALSSDTEQMPLSVIEAMAGGLPVLATDVGDVWLMVAEANAPFVAPLDDVAFAASLAAIAGDRDRRQRIGLANLAKAQREFDQARCSPPWRAVAWLASALPCVRRFRLAG